MRVYPVIITILLSPFLASSQTNISGVVNSYHKVVEVITLKSCVRVDNVSGLSANDRVMLVQMKGATVSTSNNSTFGSVSALNNAGNYELSSICSIRGDSVFLFKQLAKTYTVSEKVQLVRIPQYTSAVVVDSLKASPWDSATGKGGVLAISVSDDLILNASISGSGLGYRGGAYMTSNSTCSNFFAATDYYYNATVLSPQDGACKGESVTSLAVAYSGGKGPAANGGGGGNNHNNGGAGGSNAASGGAGGGNSSASGCSASNPGIGGYALSTSGGQKIFMGGGGGAGHANSGSASWGGGRGGAILYIQANTLYSNGFIISSNGGNGGNTLGDGASGGGGGGSVILDINTYADAPVIQAKGGNGGDENDDATSQKCYGEGGGGSGGVLYFKTATPSGTLSVAGGAKGNRLGTLNCAAFVYAVAGNNGSMTPSYTTVQSSVLSTYCAGAALPVGLTAFMVTPGSGSAVAEWKISDPADVSRFVLERKTGPEAFAEIHSVLSSGATDYAFTDKNLQPGRYDYRLKIFTNNGGTVIGPVRTIRIGDGRNKLVLFPNPATDQTSILYAFRPGSVLHIYDDLGQLVYQKKMEQALPLYKLNLSFLPKGIYRVTVDQRTGSLLIR